MRTLCIYCGQNPGATFDHIPPKCFFLKPCPNIIRITVPCCERCRLAGEKNDELVRNLLISTEEAEPHSTIQKQLAGARNRAFADCRRLDAVRQHIVLADVHSKGGIYLGSAPAFDLNTPVMDAFFDRIGRGLLHEEKSTGFVRLRSQWQLNPPQDICDNIANQGKSRTVGDIFSYSVQFLEGSLSSVWILTVYGRLRFSLHLQTPQDYTGPVQGSK